MAEILLVEDDPDVSEQFAIYLRSEKGGSHSVDIALSATQAVKRLPEKVYDLVLLDIMMPFTEEDERNEEIDKREVAYGGVMGFYVYTKILEMQNPPVIGIVSMVSDVNVLARFEKVVGILHKYLNPSLDDLGHCVKEWLAARQRIKGAISHDDSV